MIVKVRNLSKYYGKKLAVEELSFTIKSGTAIGMVGQNDSGKTAVLRMLATLDVPSEGDILIDDESIVDHPFKARKKIGFMSQQLPDLRDLTAHQYLEFYARAYKLPPARRKSAIVGAEGCMTLHNLRNKTLHELSVVEKKRLGLAGAILHDPGLLILDEPASGLDTVTQKGFIELLKLLKETGTAIVASARAMSDLGDLCEGAMVLDSGKVKKIGTFETVIKEDVEHRQIMARLAGENQDALVKVLNDIPEIISVKATGSGAVARMDASEEECAKILSLLISHNLDVAEFRQEQLDSDEIFDEMKGGSL